MSAPVHVPTSRLVGEEWVKLVVTPTPVGQKLPAISQQLRANGFVRVPTVGGSVDDDVPYQSPVIGVECWWPPPERGDYDHWFRAEQLAQRIVLATWNRALQGVQLDLSTRGAIAAAVVSDVVALGVPDAVEEDPNDWARYDVDLQINWTGV